MRARAHGEGPSADRTQVRSGMSRLAWRAVTLVMEQDPRRERLSFDNCDHLGNEFEAPSRFVLAFRMQFAHVRHSCLVSPASMHTDHLGSILLCCKHQTPASL